MLVSLNVLAQTAHLRDIQPSKSFENIHVVPLESNEHASEFIVFIKQKVKAHYHKKHTEMVYVISGEADFTLDNITTSVKAGDFMRILPGQIHSVKVTSKEALKVLSIQAPQFDGKDRVFVE